MILPVDQIDLLFVIAPHALLLDVAGPAEAVRLANYHRSLRGLPPRFRPPRPGAAGLALRRPGAPQSRASAHRADPADLGDPGRPADHTPEHHHPGDRRDRRVAAASARGIAE